MVDNGDVRLAICLRGARRWNSVSCQLFLADLRDFGVEVRRPPQLYEMGGAGRGQPSLWETESPWGGTRGKDPRILG